MAQNIVVAVGNKRLVVSIKQAIALRDQLNNVLIQAIPKENVLANKPLLSPSEVNKELSKIKLAPLN